MFVNNRVSLYFRFFDSNSQLQKVATVIWGQITGPCWKIRDGTHFLYGNCNNDLHSFEIVPGNPGLIGNLRDPVQKWITGNPVNDHKMKESRFLSQIGFNEDESW